MDPIPLPQSYHDFADKRTFLGIPNAMDVFSNIAIAIPAIYLLQKQNKFSLLSVHILVLSIASTYYHLQPSDDRIFWDMMAVSTTHVVIASFFIEKEYAIPLYIASILSVVYWKSTDDLRPYIVILVGIPIYLFLLLHKNKKITNYLYLIILFNSLARVTEHNDHSVYKLTGNQISGHTMKHIFGGIVSWLTILVLMKLNKIK